MSLSKQQKVFIENHVEEIFKLFNIEEERCLLEKYFPSDDVNKWIDTAKNRCEQAESFCLEFIKKGNNDFYAALADLFLRRSQNYKSIYNEMMSSADQTPLENSQCSIKQDTVEFDMKVDLIAMKNQMNELLQKVNEITKIQLAASSSEHSNEQHHNMSVNVRQYKHESVFGNQMAMMDRDVDRNTSLHWEAKLGNSENIELLLQQSPILLDMKNRDECTALHLAVELDQLDAAKTLLKFGASPEMRDKNGQTVMHYAAKNGKAEIVEILLLQSRDLVDMKDKQESTPIQLAINGLYLDVIEILLNGEATLDVNSPFIKPVFMSSLENRKIRIVEKLLHLSPNLVECRNNNETNVLTWAVEKKYWDFVKILVKYNAAGDTPLHDAAKNGNHQIVEELLLQSRDLVDVKNSRGETPIQLAMNGKPPHWNVIEILLEYNCSVEVKDKDEATLLYLATRDRKDEMVERILKISTASIDEKYNDWSALHFAAANDLPNIVEILLKNGADPHLRNSINQTPADVAKLFDQKQAVERLMREKEGSH